MRHSTSYGMPDLEPCKVCKEKFACLNWQDPVCFKCEFAEHIKQEAHTSCGAVTIRLGELYKLHGAADRLLAQGWVIDLAVPTRQQQRRNELTIIVRSTLTTNCKGKPEATPRCYATACGAIPSPDAVHAVRQETCRKSCPVAAFGSRQVEIDALTTRCCTALSQMTVSSLKIEIMPEELPALIGTARNLENAGWSIWINGERNGWFDTKIGTIKVHPSRKD